MARTFTADELAGEAGVSPDRIEWLVSIGILDEHLDELTNC